MNHIASEFSLSERFRFEKLLTELFATFVNVDASEIDDKIRHALRCIGQHLKIDRSHLIQADEQTESYRITHSWAKEGVDPVPIGFSDKEVPWIASQLMRKRIVRFNRVDDLPHEAGIDRLIIHELKIKSHVSIPLVENQRVIGALSLDQVQSGRIWFDDLVLRLKIVADVLLNLLIKRRSDERLKQAFREIRQLTEQLEIECNYLREEILNEHNFEDIVGKSAALRQAISKVEYVAPTDTTVLILGETGTGKELIARAIHKMSLRRNAPLIKVNCANLPSNLIESELFGHERGAFTGATCCRKGRFEIADGATLFLDEIGEMPLETQGKLLTVLESGEFERLGSSQTLRVDVRIVAATNRKLEKEVKEGRFRKDLWYRLNVFSIVVPPLRQRLEDIPLLVNWILKKLCKQLGKRIDRIPAHTIKALENYSWPGNIRELRNVIERAAINSKGNVLHLLDKLESHPPEPVSGKWGKTLHQIEQEYITRVLKETRWQIEGDRGAAVILGLPPSTLRARMKKHRIQRPWD